MQVHCTIHLLGNGEYAEYYFGGMSKFDKELHTVESSARIYEHSVGWQIKESSQFGQNI